MQNTVLNTALKISEGLAGLPTIDYRTLAQFQGDLKTLSEVEFTKLKLVLFGDGAIPQTDFFVPLMVWFEPKSKKPYILDGHQRVNVIKACNGTPHELPYIKIIAKNKIEAKQKLALVNSQYGKFSRDGWDSFMHDVDVDWVRGLTTLEAFTLPPLTPVVFDAPLSDSQPSANSIRYAEEEIDMDRLMQEADDLSEEGQRHTIVLNYTAEDYAEITQALKKHGGTKEDIFYRLITA